MAIDEQALERVRLMWQDLAPLQSEPSFDDYRREANAMFAKFPVPDDIETEEVDAGGVQSLWVSAPGVSDDRVLILFHGGGYIMLSPTSYREYAYRLSRAMDARVLVPDYRLSPENPFGSGIDDCVAAYRWLASQVTPDRIVMTGDSAGGGMVLSVSVSLRDAGDTLPAALILASPLTDLAGEGQSYVDNADRDIAITRDVAVGMGAVYLEGRDPKETTLGSPLYADLSGLPPMYVAVGGAEVLRDDSTRVVDKVRSTGGEAELEIADDMQHVYPVFACLLPEGRTAIENFGRFARERTAVPVG